MPGEHDKPLRPGSLEELVLRAVLHFNGEGYGGNIKPMIEAAMNKSMTYGGIYTTLDRLEQKGFVESSWTEPTGERGGRRKQVFRITGAGEGALSEAERATRRMQEAFGGLRPATEGGF